MTIVASEGTPIAADAKVVPQARVLLVNQELVPHYRVPVYNYLASYLAERGFALTVLSEGVQTGNAHPVTCDHQETKLVFPNIARVIRKLDPKVVIYWVRLRHLYLFPMLALIKGLGKKAIYWGHGLDLINRRGLAAKKVLNAIEYSISDALILYGNEQKRHVPQRFHGKSFVANNTLHIREHTLGAAERARCLAKYKIQTQRNIICVGRMQKRKRLEDLFKAFDLLNDPEVGLILVGPDIDGVSADVSGKNVYKLGPIYGDERLDLMAAADVFCLPGAVGLSIVDAFHCGLPLITQAQYESPEMMYLKDGINGFVTPPGDVNALAEKLKVVLKDAALREKFSQAARQEMRTNGHIDRMCEGFHAALVHVTRQKQPR